MVNWDSNQARAADSSAFLTWRVSTGDDAKEEDRASGGGAGRSFGQGMCVHTLAVRKKKSDWLCPASKSNQASALGLSLRGVVSGLGHVSVQLCTC